MMRNGDGFIAGMITGAVVGAAIVMMLSPSIRRQTVDAMGEMVDGMGSRMGRMMRRGRRAAEEIIMPEELS